MKNELINEIKARLIDKLEEKDAEAACNEVILALREYNVTRAETELALYDTETDKMINRWITTKKLEGRSEKTLVRYHRQIKKLFEFLNVSIDKVDVYALRLFLLDAAERGCKPNTINGIRDILSSFFGWVYAEGYIEKNPCVSLSAIKCKKEIKSPFGRTEIERLKSVCRSKRDIAMLEFLLSTGCRVGELISININDLDFITNQVKVLGKGNKERVVFFNDVCAMRLKEYLEERNDNYNALFIGKGSPRLKTGTVRFILKKWETESGVDNVHPHRFRRTFATLMADRGMQVQDIARLLGHESLNTTMVYVSSSLDIVKSNYARCNY